MQQLKQIPKRVAVRSRPATTGMTHSTHSYALLFASSGVLGLVFPSSLLRPLSLSLSFFLFLTRSLVFLSLLVSACVSLCLSGFFLFYALSLSLSLSSLDHLCFSVSWFLLVLVCLSGLSVLSLVFSYFQFFVLYIFFVYLSASLFFCSVIFCFLFSYSYAFFSFMFCFASQFVSVNFFLCRPFLSFCFHLYSLFHLVVLRMDAPFPLTLSFPFWFPDLTFNFLRGRLSISLFPSPKFVSIFTLASLTFFLHFDIQLNHSGLYTFIFTHFAICIKL